MIFVAILLGVMVSIGVFAVVWEMIPRSTKCKCGFHDWMKPSYPFWGNKEQGTYCCDLVMKIEQSYKDGKCISEKRVPLTEEDYEKKALVLRKRAVEYEREQFEKRLRQDMKSDDYCEELLP
jgi:hypothetical protein